MHNQGDGVAYLRHKPRHGENARIEWLGKMHDAYTVARDAGDTATMLQVAVEYDEKGMRKMASDIRIAVSRMER